MSDVSKNAFSYLLTLVFPPNLLDVKFVNDEHGQRFHEEAPVMDATYKARFNAWEVGGCCWFLYSREKRCLRSHHKESHAFIKAEAKLGYSK